jgi:hypothetical protein
VTIADPDADADMDSSSYLRPQAAQHMIDLTAPTDDEVQLSDADESVVAESSFSRKKILSHNPWSTSDFADF